MNRQDKPRDSGKHPPAGRNDDATQALQAGRHEATPRKSTHATESSTREAGSDDRRSGSESGKS